MKKILLLLLTFVGMVSTASADDITVYFQITESDDNWQSAAARYAMCLQNNDASVETWVSFSSVSKTGYDRLYQASFTPNNSYTKMFILRMNPNTDTNSWGDGIKWNQSGILSVPTKNCYFAKTGTNKTWSNDWTYSPRLLPWDYYFISNTGDDNAWVQGDKMTESTGTYSYTFNASDYSGKYFAWCSGDALSLTESILDWSKVFASSGAGGEAEHMGFLNISYPDMYPDQNGQRWHVLSSLVTSEAKISISYTPSSNSAIVSASRYLTIGSAGYATWSNDEKYEIDGTNVDDVYVVTANNTGYVTLTSKKGSTFPAGEGVIIKGSGEVKINSVASDAVASTIGTNYLVGKGNSASTPAAGDGIYVFWWDGTNSSSIGFYKAADDGAELAAHKAYLDIRGASAREFLAFSFDNEATGISEVSNKRNDGVIYNLQGQRNNMLKKGINIVNGKKVFVK